MSYVVGLVLAAVAVTIAAAAFRSGGSGARGMFALALMAGALVFYTVLGNPGLTWIRTLDCIEVALAALLPLLAIAASGRAFRRRFYTRLPAVLLVAMLVLSITDAAGLTYTVTGWLPGIGLVEVPGVFSDNPFFFGAAQYCGASIMPLFIAVAAAGVGGALGVAVAKRDRRLAGGLLASACLFGATFLTRDINQCVPYSARTTAPAVGCAATDP